MHRASSNGLNWQLVSLLLVLVEQKLAPLEPASAEGGRGISLNQLPLHGVRHGAGSPDQPTMGSSASQGASGSSPWLSWFCNESSNLSRESSPWIWYTHIAKSSVGASAGAPGRSDTPQQAVGQLDGTGALACWNRVASVTAHKGARVGGSSVSFGGVVSSFLGGLTAGLCLARLDGTSGVPTRLDGVVGGDSCSSDCSKLMERTLFLLPPASAPPCALFGDTLVGVTSPHPAAIFPREGLMWGGGVLVRTMQRFFEGEENGELSGDEEGLCSKQGLTTSQFVMVVLLAVMCFCVFCS